MSGSNAVVFSRRLDLCAGQKDAALLRSEVPPVEAHLPSLPRGRDTEKQKQAGCL